MSAEEYFDEWELDSNDDLPHHDKETRSKKLDRDKQRDDWDESDDIQKKGKKNTRWRDIEDRLDKQRLGRHNSWDYGDYDF